MNAEQIKALGARLLEIAALLNPQTGAAVATVVKVVQVAADLNGLVRAIRDNDPEMWAKVSADYTAASAGFAESVARQAGE